MDGLIVASTISVVALAPHGKQETWYPWALLAAGAVVSVTANAAHALVADNDLPGTWAAAISAVPRLVVLAMTHFTVKLTSRTDHQRPRPGREADGLAPRQRRLVIGTPVPVRRPVDRAPPTATGRSPRLGVASGD